jgi:hypothetical protein
MILSRCLTAGPASAAIFVLLLGLAPAPLAAQRFEVGVGAGFALPLREFRVGSKPGLEQELTLKLQPGQSPVSIRVDLTHAAFAGRAAPTFIYPRTRVTALAGSAEYDFNGEEESRWRGWAFGGIGAYYTVADQGTPQILPFGRTYFGVQFGIGGAYRMGSLNPFIELQYVTVFRSKANVRTLPLLIGIRVGHRRYSGY